MADLVRILLDGADAPRDLSVDQRARLQATLAAEADAPTAALLRAAAGPRPLPAATRTALLSRLARRRPPLVAGPRLLAVVGAAAAAVLVAGAVAVSVRPAAEVGPLARPSPTLAVPTPSASGQSPAVEVPAVGGVTQPVPSPSTSSWRPTSSPVPPVTAPDGPAGAPAAPNAGPGAPFAQQSVSGVSPGAGALAGGTVVTIRGAGLSSVVRVEFGRRAATDVNVESDSRVTARTPSGARAGSVDVVVVTADGGRYGLSPAFTYVAAPVLTSLSPESGPMGGGNVVVLSGTHLRGDAVVRFGTVEAEIVEASPTALHVVVPGQFPGAVDVTVTTVGGTSERRRYTYLPG